MGKVELFTAIYILVIMQKFDVLCTWDNEDGVYIYAFLYVSCTLCFVFFVGFSFQKLKVNLIVDSSLFFYKQF